METYKPGEKAPQSGDYRVIGQNGEEVKSGVTMDAGESFPPTPNSGQRYVKQ